MIGTLLLALAASAVGLSSQQSLVEGFAESKVRVLIYEDLQCPDCAAFRRMMDESLVPRYASRVAFVHRDFPLAKHAWARKAAIAARYFAGVKPEMGLAYRRYILSTIHETTPDNFNDRLAQFARDQRIDPQPAVAALEDPRLAALVERDFQDGVARGLAKTPTVLVGDKLFVEHFAVEAISQAIDDALVGR
jgi:protein-disulfide isomerase